MREQQSHWEFTYKQWSSDEKHYIDLVNFLDSNRIESYIDLGANTGGVCSVLLEKIASLKECHLFEPQIENFNFMENKFENDSRVKCYPYGIFYTNQERMKLLRCDNNIGGYTVVKHNDSFKESSYEMEVKKIEDFTFPKIDFIKIDVEGSEKNILLNSKTLKEIKFIELELHEDLLSPEKSIDFINKNLETHIINFELSHLPTHIFLQKIA